MSKILPKRLSGSQATSLKQVVLYTDLLDCVVGCSATVIPLDHPSYRVINGRLCYTSEVLSYDPVTGDFETRNTLYKRAEGSVAKHAEWAV